MKRLVEVLRANGHEFDNETLEHANSVTGVEWTRVWREEYRTLQARDWLGLVFDQLNVALPQPEFDTLAVYFDEALLDIDPPLQLVKDARDVVARLTQRYRLGIISDTGITGANVLRHFLKRDQMLEHFACLTFSDEAGVSKPHPDVFRLTLKCLDVQPEETIHIGDLARTDIGGAKAAGMNAVRFTGVNDDADRSVAPDATVDSFVDFEQLVEAWDKRVKSTT